jgi:hypothetical protein
VFGRGSRSLVKLRLTYIEKLSAVLDEMENNIDEFSQSLEATRQKTAKLESTCSEGAAKVSQSAVALNLRLGILLMGLCG